MKTLRYLLAGGCLVFICQCASRTPHAPGDSAFSGAEESAYRRAYYHGFDDGKRNRDDDFEHYHHEYDDRTEKAFERGYSQGYEAGKDQADAGEEVKDQAYSQGIELGRADCENGQSPFYQRHSSVYTPATENSFRRGYVEGYKDAREDGGGASAAEKKAYDAGYRAGELDHERARELNADAHIGEASRQFDEFFRKGYRDGYSHRTPRY